MNDRFELRRDGDFLIMEVEKLINTIVKKDLHLQLQDEKFHNYVIETLNTVVSYLAENEAKQNAILIKLEYLENTIICQQKTIINKLNERNT